VSTQPAPTLNRESLEDALGYRFRRPELLALALTHRSAASEAPPEQAQHAGGVPELGTHNERLEFLGDAVLALAASEALVRTFPNWSEGHLSKSRANLTSAGTLAHAARRLEFGTFVRIGKGEEKTGGREKPGLLADAFEAVVAAIYLDGGLEAARVFLGRTVLSQVSLATGAELAQSDRKSALQEYLQGRGLAPALYVLSGESGPDHLKQFEVEVWVEGKRLAAGKGTTKKQAEQRAADAALLQLAREIAKGA